MSLLLPPIPHRPSSVALLVTKRVGGANATSEMDCVVCSLRCISRRCKRTLAESIEWSTCCRLRRHGSARRDDAKNDEGRTRQGDFGPSPTNDTVEIRSRWMNAYLGRQYDGNIYNRHNCVERQLSQIIRRRDRRTKHVSEE